MRRRKFITLLGTAAAVWPFAANAQQPDPTRRIGVLMGLPEDDPETKAYLTAFRQGLERFGWSEGRNVRIDYRFAVGNPNQVQALAKELVALQLDLIFASTTPVVRALQQQSGTIPIVFVNVSDPIGSGIVGSLARPGGNLTGLLLYEEGITGKWLAMLKEIEPRLARVAVIANPKTLPYNYYLRAAEARASSLAIKLVPRPVENAADIERVMESFAREPNSGLVLLPSGTIREHRDLIIALAARHRLPAVYPFRFFVDDGGLMSYGINNLAMFQQAVSLVDRILRGAKPADLPVEAPSKYETILNLKTAKALGLSVPPTLLVRADEVIE